MLVYVEIVKDYEDIYLFVFELKTIGNQKKIAHMIYKLHERS